MTSTDRIDNLYGERTPFSSDEPWPQRVDQFLTVDESDVERWVPSACVLCSNGCGIDLAVRQGKLVGVRGRAQDRISHGRLGPKGLFGWQANQHEDRLTTPLIRRNGKLEPASWDEALSLVVNQSRSVMDQFGRLGMAFYTSGQLFAEEYYALTVLARGGIGTPHLDGNTRLCTATASWALVESFGCDGNPGSYRDFDLCDTLMLVGHNVAETQTVLWTRILDRLEDPDRPQLIVIDPRLTLVAQRANVHLAIRPGTNVAILNGIMHELIEHEWVDRKFVNKHTTGFEELEKTVAPYRPEVVAEICGVSTYAIHAAADIIGSAERLVSTVLQGVYQSNQATAAAVQVNNVNLLRGMIGRPGATVFQMNGQPTAENTRETGANGMFPAFFNWHNEQHVARIAAAWNVEPSHIPHWSPPTHAMEIFRQCELGSIRFLWVSGTNPAVSLPQLARIREIYGQDRLFLVVSDAYLTETAELADVVLPVALWGEKEGCFTNADRTVHLSEKAIDPPGEARSDFDIFCEYARRLELRDKDGQPLISWQSTADAWAAFTALTEGQTCDQTRLTYDLLRDSPGIQWPCHDAAPRGTERLYADHVFPTAAERCESYGHELVTGAAYEPSEYRASDPRGKAILRPAKFSPPHEETSDDFPLQLITGRTVYHFHTRTKTGRVAKLNDAAPEPWVEISRSDADELGIREGDLVEVASSRGSIKVAARITKANAGSVFVPFHFGRMDPAQSTAANELTRTIWDPVSKQPLLKAGAVRVSLAARGEGPSFAPTTTASAPDEPLRERPTADLLDDAKAVSAR